MDLELTYPDGSSRVIGSDEQFLSCESFIRYSDLYIGEMQDGACPDAEMFFRSSPEAYGTAGNDERSNQVPDPVWSPCRVVSYDMETLTPQPIPGIRAVKEIPVVSYIDNPKGELVADFGQVLAGVVRIRVKAAAGTLITLEHGEVLDREGNYYSNIKGLYKDQKDRFLCRGGEQEFTPHFTYHGFRYVRISGIAKDEILELTAVCYATPFAQIGFFETDNDMINALQTAIQNSTISNMISVPTDCPQREKLGWTGDINIFTRTGAFLYDLRDFLGTWLWQVRVDQLPDGEIPVVVPNHPCQEKMQRGMSGGTNSSAAWSDCCIFMPLAMYHSYGDPQVLIDNYDTMERWLSYVEKQAHGYLWNGRFHFGDWLIPSLREEPDGVMKGVMATSDITGSCYYAMAVSAMAQVCQILGKEERALYYEALLEQIRTAIQAAYVYEDGRVGVHAAACRAQGTDLGRTPDCGPDAGDLQLQGLYVIMLKSGAVTDPTVKQRMLDRLVTMIRESGYTLDCGFSSIGFLLDLLYDNGYQDVAFRLLFSTKAPSWLYMIQNGATTIWENWRAILEDGTVTDSSYNHYAYGCVGDFMYRHIGGLQGLEPGFARVRIAPDFDCGIRRSSLSRVIPGAPVSPDGQPDPERTIRCSWELQDAGGDTPEKAPHGTLKVQIPAGVTAQIVLPDETFEVPAGAYEYRF